MLVFYLNSSQYDFFFNEGSICEYHKHYITYNFEFFLKLPEQQDSSRIIGPQKCTEVYKKGQFSKMGVLLLHPLAEPEAILIKRI